MNDSIIISSPDQLRVDDYVTISREKTAVTAPIRKIIPKPNQNGAVWELYLEGLDTQTFWIRADGGEDGWVLILAVREVDQ